MRNILFSGFAKVRNYSFQCIEKVNDVKACYQNITNSLSGLATSPTSPASSVILSLRILELVTEVS